MMRLVDLAKLIAVSLIIRINSQVTIAKNTQVTPRCGSQLISIEINFDPSQLPGGKFNDWIVVGVSGRPECRLRGNGETKYIIEIAVFNDPCLTQIPARNVFQNRIRIGKNPVVILEGDQSITVKCVYGSPTVETLAMPVINPNFNIDNLGQFGSNAAVSSGNTQTALTAHSSFSNNENSQTIPNNNNNGDPTGNGNAFQSMNSQFKNDGGDAIDPNQNRFNSNLNQFLNSQTRTDTGSQGESNQATNEMSSIDNAAEEVNRGRATENIPFPNAGFTPSQFNFNTNNPIRPQIPVTSGNEDLQLITSFPAVSSGPQEQQQENDNFGLTSSKRRSSFSILFILAIIFAVILVLLLLFCLYFILRKRREERNRRLLIDGVSSADEGKRNGSRAWWTEGSTDGYASPGTAQAESVDSNDKNQHTSRVTAATLFEKRNIKPAESREVPIPTVSVRKNRSDITSTHYSKAGQVGNNRHNSSASVKTSKKSPAPLPPRTNLPLRSNLEEFVSKTYAMGDYNDMASPAYAYTSEFYDEREVDIGFGTNKSRKIKRRPRAEEEKLANDENAVSSYRSITEIVHAAETANISREIPKTDDKENEMDKLLIDCVMTIRGFGYRKLTEQEIGRWKNLIQRDHYLRDMLVSSKSVAEIENIFESDNYRNMFSSTKWHEIAQCVNRCLTSSLDRTNSQSQLQLFVGNVQSDW